MQTPVLWVVLEDRRCRDVFGVLKDGLLPGGGARSWGRGQMLGAGPVGVWAGPETIKPPDALPLQTLLGLNMEEVQEVLMEQTRRNSTKLELPEVYEAIRWIQLTMALLSCLGSTSVIARVTCLGRGRSPELQPLLLLTSSDLLLHLYWLLEAALYPLTCRGGAYTHTLQQVLYLSSFFFTLNYVWNLFRGIQEKFYCFIHSYPGRVSNRVSTAGRTVALLSGLLPVLLVAPIFIGETLWCGSNSNSSALHGCLLTRTSAPAGPCARLHATHLAIFLCAFVFTLASIMVLMGKMRCIYRRVVTSHGYLGSQQRASFRVLDLRILLYPLIFFLCWGPVVGVVVLQMAKPPMDKGTVGVVLYISQAFTTASQGFLNSLVYGWTQSHLGCPGGMALARDAHTQTPLLRVQKKRSYQALRNTG